MKEEVRKSRMKVLHVVENLDRGAVENWLLRMLVYGRAQGIDLEWSFYCTLGQPGRLDQIARDSGAQVIYSPFSIQHKTRFVTALRTEIQRGKYDVLHCHHDLISGLYLLAAVGLPIRRRIVHVHNADECVLTPSPAKQAVFRPLLRKLCLTLADRIVGISNHTLDTFLRGRPRKPSRDLVHYYGIDPSPFILPVDNRTHFRKTLGLPDNSRIFLFAGRMVPEKNPLFAVDVLAELCKREPRAFGVFAGAGSLEAAAIDRARELGLNDRIRMLGFRSDIPEIMSACDWFILPRPEKPMEGLGIAVLEAQLAGLRLLLSNGIADDPLLPKASYARLALATGAEKWAEAALALLDKAPSSSIEAAIELSKSPFDMRHALNELLSLHS